MSRPASSLDENRRKEAALLFGRPDAHLLDPNYYRLYYQLAAQRLNDAIDQRNHEDSAPEQHADASSVQTKARLDWERRDLDRQIARNEAGLANIRSDKMAALAQGDAETIVKTTFKTISRLVQIAQTKPRLRRARKLNTQQARLLRFLEETVSPCAELVVAGAIAAQGHPVKANERAAPVRDRVIEPKDTRFLSLDPKDKRDPAIIAAERIGEAPASFRVAYNLACYEAALLDESVADENSQPTPAAQRALFALRIALRDAPNRRQRTALVTWAEEDPALEPLTQFSVFQDLLRSNELQDASPAQVDGSTEREGAARETLQSPPPAGA